MTDTPQPPSRDARFIQYLRGLASTVTPTNDDAAPSAATQKRKNLAALAALRRGLGKELGTAPEMYPYVVPFLPDNTRSRQEMPYYLVAALFAWHQTDWPGANTPGLGGSLARLRFTQAETRNDKVEPGDSVERRFVALLNANRDDLPDHLRQIIGLLRSSETPVSWLRLLQDIKGWDHPDRWVQRRWAREFWGRDLAHPVAAGDPSTTTSSETSAS